MWVSNDPETPASWITEGDEPHDRIKRWVISKYRHAHQPGARNETHLSTCDQIEVVFDLHDGYYGCDCNDGGGCPVMLLEATLSCAHGVTREWEFNDLSTDVADQLAELKAWEDRVREQTLNPAVIIGVLEGEDVMPMVVVYWNTQDYPDLYVARQHDIGVGRVAVHPEPLKVSPSLDEVRAVVPVGMVPMAPAGNDDPNIVEVYV